MGPLYKYSYSSASICLRTPKQSGMAIFAYPASEFKQADALPQIYGDVCNIYEVDSRIIQLPN